MSKKIAPTRGEGITTSAILAEPPTSGTAREFSVATFAKALDTTVTNAAVNPMQTAVDAFGWLSTLQATIKEIAEEGARNRLETPNGACGALSRIQTLADIGHYLADDIGDHIDCVKESLRDEHLPALLAALPQRGEA